MPRKKNGKKGSADRERADFQEQYAKVYEEYKRRQLSFKPPSAPVLVRRDSLPPLKNRYEKGTDNKWRLVEN